MVVRRSASPEDQRHLKVPFDTNHEFFPATAQHSNERLLALPATYQTSDQVTHRTASDLCAFLQTDLLIPRLNDIHDWLWIAGFQLSARPLHRQLHMNRTVVLAEQIDLHLLWHDSTIYIKPLPVYLLSADFWNLHLCPSPGLHACALGLLLSYSWLVCYPSDFRIAQQLGLLDAKITFEVWSAFMDSVVSSIELANLDGVNKRYLYGELRIERVKTLYRLYLISKGHFYLPGYKYMYFRYRSFFRRNFGWLFTMFAFVTVMLTAMQTGLATRALGENQAFQNAAYGLTVFSLFLPLMGGTITLMGLIWFLAKNSVFWAVAIQRQRRKLRSLENDFVDSPTGTGEDRR